MSAVASVVMLLLSSMFALAGAAKVRDRSGTRRAVEAFGVPGRFVPAAAVLLPLVELAIAASLIVPATARWGTAAAAALLTIFCVAIIRVLRSGASPDCNCFGGLTQTEVGRGTLIRNLLLILAAALAAAAGAHPRVGAVSWTALPAARDRVVVVGLVLCVAALGWACWLVLRQNGRLVLALEAQPAPATGRRATLHPDDLAPLEPGVPAPEFAGRDLDGAPVSLRSLLAAGRPVVLFFTDPGCVACVPGLELAAATQRERADELTLAVISHGSAERMAERAAQLGLRRVIPQSDDTLLEAYRVFAVPAVVLLDRDGRLVRPVALGAGAAREIIDGVQAEKEEAFA